MDGNQIAGANVLSYPPAQGPTGAPQVYAAIAAVSRELSKLGIDKSDYNQGQNFSFRGIDAVMKALSPLLVRAGLLALPRVEKLEFTEHPTKDGKGVQFNSRVTVAYQLISVADGSSVTVSSVGEGMDNRDKATSKAMSIAYKYFAFQAFCIPVEGQDDTDAGSPAESAPKRNVPAEPEAAPVRGDTNGTPAAKAAPSLNSFEAVLEAIKAAKTHDELQATRRAAGTYTNHARIQELRDLYAAARARVTA